MTFKEVSPQTLNFNPFTRIGSDWMLITAGQPGDMNTMTASWGGAGVLWTKNVVTAYIRPQRYTKEFVDREDIFTLSFFDEKYRPALKHLGTVSGRQNRRGRPHALRHRGQRRLRGGKYRAGLQKDVRGRHQAGEFLQRLRSRHLVQGKRLPRHIYRRDFEGVCKRINTKAS